MTLEGMSHTTVTSSILTLLNAEPPSHERKSTSMIGFCFEIAHAAILPMLTLPG